MLFTDNKLNAEIEYRYDCGHTLGGASMGREPSAEEAANTESFKHVPSGHGEFHITINERIDG